MQTRLSTMYRFILKKEGLFRQSFFHALKFDSALCVLRYIATNWEAMHARYIQGADRIQIVLFSDTLDDYVGADNEVRAIDSFVSRLL